MKYAVVFLFVLVGTVAFVGGASPYRKVKSTNQDPSVTPSHLPTITSSIKNIEVVNAFVDDQAELNIVLRNKSEKGIQAITVSAGNFSQTLDEGLVTDHPKTIIKAKADYTISIPVANLKITIAVVISGVIYEDDSDEGSVKVVSKIRKARQTERLKRLSKAPEPIVN